ncbi:MULTISPECIES: response regulator transcription factor [Lysobacter]|jgi:two-component system response regulator RegA|uniref:response regulator transcription factor n=1 Tax=Lysobacter TaxID=68 RepID=UPI001F41891B|nr:MULTISPECIES: response regulator [Lysobacter]UJB21704.1 response regulator [Lysobacter capsici]UJQ29179.1 response regulator [Lysobacter gummosus]
MSLPVRMLLVDDDLAFCQVLARMLARRGVEVQARHDAASALAALEDFAADGIVLDLKLGADNGLLLIHDLRARCPQARIVLATGYASIATAVDAMRRGAWNYLPKPFDIDALAQAFESPSPQAPPPEPPAEPPSLRRQGWEHMQRVLAECGGNVSAAARMLGVDRRTLQRKLAKRPVRERPE